MSPAAVTLNLLTESDEREIIEGIQNQHIKVRVIWDDPEEDS